MREGDGFLIWNSGKSGKGFWEAARDHQEGYALQPTLEECRNITGLKLEGGNNVRADWLLVR
jgi:hypothetical protein